MNPTKKETVKDIAKRFMWIDADTVRITNIEGLEKVVDIRNGFKEIGYAAVPLFNEINLTTLKNYYLDKASLELGDTYQRLLRKF
jgi:hypothetical protein